MNEREKEPERKMGYRKMVIEIIENIESEEVLKFVYCMLSSFQKKWGI